MKTNSIDADVFAKKIMSKLEIESPSPNFTENLIAELENQKSLQYLYKPLLPPKLMKVLIAGFVLLFIGIIIYGLFFGKNSDADYSEYYQNWFSIPFGYLSSFYNKMANNPVIYLTSGSIAVLLLFNKFLNIFFKNLQEHPKS